MAEKSDERAVHINTTGGQVRLSQPEGSSRRRRPSKAKVVVEVVKPTGFIGFLREHAIVGLAIGFVVGTQVQSIVKQLIDGFINPLSQLLFPGNKALSSRTFTLHFDNRHANFGWGLLVYQLINFLFILFVIYLIIKILKLDKLDKPKK